MEPRVLQVGSKEILVREARVEEIIPLRHRILRAGLPIEEAHFPGDRDATTCHVAAFEGSEAVGCATFVLNQWNGEPAWQLRGMATDAALRSAGIGAAVLRCAIELATARSPVRLLWCNARVPALKFYLRHGWKIVSDQFDIPTAGPHHKMLWHPASPFQV